MIKVPVRIRGVDYPSIRSAARALGVGVGTVCTALDRGTVDHVGLRRANSNETISVVVPASCADEVRAAIMSLVSSMGIQP